MEKLLLRLLLGKEMNKWFNFYWKKEIQILIFKIMFFENLIFFFFLFFLSFFSFFFLFFFFFLSFLSFLKFLIFFFFPKDGETALSAAASRGYKQVVQLLLEKGNPNLDLPDKVLLFLIFFLISFDSFFFLLLGK